MNLFDLFDDAPSKPLANDTWRPEAPPSLDGEKEICLNFETTGLRWFDRDKPISVSLYAKGRSWYLPWGHRGAGNLSEEQVREWLRREVRGKHIININTRFDVQMAYKFGVDLEAQGNTVSDVSHSSALLDDHRLRNNLDVLIKDFLWEQPMARLDESRMASYTAGVAAPRAMYNVEAVHRLNKKMWPELEREDLVRVKHLEDEVIYVVCEMERNGSPVNHELLDLWIKQSQKDYEQALYDVYKATGLRVNPGSSQDMARLFRHLHIEIVERTAKGQPSFTDEVLKYIDHPTIKLVRLARKMKNLNSKLRAYADGLDDNGILRYALHQLRASKSDDANAGESGTVTGRFTSTEIVDGVGVNIQQVLKPEKQFSTSGDKYFMRMLHIPEDGMLWLSADAEQIQYRIAAMRAGNPQVLEAYKKDPWTSYHKMTWGILKKFKPDLTYKKTKDTNFAKLFAAGPSKIALMLEFISKKQFEELRAARANRRHPLLQQVAEILDVYKRVFPEIDTLIQEASHRAETLGYITTLLGRRCRFPDGNRLHKALNSEVQGTEADIVKTKLVELHRERKTTNFKLRFQVHDEVNGDVPDEKSASLVGEILNNQSFSFTIPILWGVKTGTSWGDCAREELDKLRKEAIH